LFGERAHVRFETAGPDIAAQIERVLDEAGLTVSDVRQIEPSLEDVFIARLGEAAS
jgi:hypothetical protein